MSVTVKIAIRNKADDIDKANDWVEEVKELLKGKVEGSFRSSISNSNPSEKLIQEQESE